MIGVVAEKDPQEKRVAASPETVKKFIALGAEAVVETAIAANDAGRVVVVPGLHNKLAALLLRRLPQGLVRAMVSAGSAKYRPQEGNT